MNKKIRGDVAVIQSEQVIITDTQSALDFMADIEYFDNVYKIAINKEAFAEDFFKLSSGMAGEILQKFVNYKRTVAIYGDFSGYTSKPLRDFMYESNHGREIFFAGNEQEAVARLTRA